MTIRVEHADCLEAIPRLVAEGVLCDSVVTDPPYHLVQIAERSKYPVKYGKDGAMQRLLGGFMNQTWDGGDIAFRPETWATIATILRPGAFLVAFGGTRTFHRLVSAIEDAGFVVQDQIAWLFGSGFPKRRDMLKPAHEPICLAYKPGGKRTMQIDECRIGTEGGYTNLTKSDGEHRDRWEGNTYTGIRVENGGRWPANVTHDGSDEVLAAFPESKGQQGDVRGDEPSQDSRQILAGLRDSPFAARNDTGSAARFFYTAKADKTDRWGSRHPTVKPVNLIAWLVALVTPPGGTFLDPFAGSGTAAAAALKTGRNAILIEREAQYVADIRERVAHYIGDGVHSVVAKNRNRPQEPGPLFARPYDEAADLHDSYYAAVEEVGRRVKAGEPVPECLLPKRAAE